ncbi:cytochrome P450 [Coniochaeta sp. 2T2.1]|nr:cytochrome P450 [Coniochaeta sp. 2T2.1]
MEFASHVTAKTAIAALVVALITKVLWKVTSNVLFSPIPSSVPGPFIARLTKKWILFVDLSGYRARTVHELHKKYGPVVRLAPNELSFASLPAIKPVYGAGTTCVKSSAYDNFGRLGMFQMQDPAMHRERQKRVALVFSQSSLQSMEPLVQGVIDKMISVVQKNLGKPLDALHWCRMTALDISGEVLMGKSFGAFDSNGIASTYVHHLDNAYLVWSLFGLAPWLCTALGMLPIKSMRQFFDAGDYVYDYGNNALQEYLKLNGRSSKRRTLLSKIIQGDPATGSEPLPDPQISIEVSNLVFAATDTTGNTMTYAMYRLCCHPEWQDKLRAELRSSGAKAAGYSYQSLQNLPVLNGVVMETMRLHPAAPSGLPRVATQNMDIGGTFVPAKTHVSVQAFTTQRDPKIFPDPDTFDPNRWITASGELDPGSPEMREMILVWGKGTRACLGQYMATMEIKILLARMMDRFSVEKVATTDGEMEMTDHFTLIPKGLKCTLVFSNAA